MKKIIIRSFLVIVLVFSVWYHIPQKIEKRYDVSTTDGKTNELTVNFKLRKSFISQDKVSGQLEFNGKTFKHFNSTSGQSMIDRFKKKLNGEMSIPLFIEADFRGSAMDAEKILILSSTRSFEHISIVYYGYNDTEAYNTDWFQ